MYSASQFAGHDEIRAFGSYQLNGVFRLDTNQSFRKPAHLFFRHFPRCIRRMGWRAACSDTLKMSECKRRDSQISITQDYNPFLLPEHSRQFAPFCWPAPPRQQISPFWLSIVVAKAFSILPRPPVSNSTNGK